MVTGTLKGLASAEGRRMGFIRDFSIHTFGPLCFNCALSPPVLLGFWSPGTFLVSGYHLGHHPIATSRGLMTSRNLRILEGVEAEEPRKLG